MSQPLIQQDQIEFNVGFSLLPTGAILPFGGSTAPTGFLLCDGSVVSQTTYPNLYSVIGTTYNIGGELPSEFRLPNLNGRVPVGVDGATFAAPGTTTGAETHTLTTTEMPSHDHGGSALPNGSHTHTGSISSTDISHTHGTNTGSTAVGGTPASVPFANGAPGGEVTTDSSGGSHSHSLSISGVANHNHAISFEGGGGAHNNIQPSIALNFIIAV